MKKDLDPIEFIAKALDTLEAGKLMDHPDTWRELSIALMYFTWHLYKKQLATEKLLRKVLRE